VNGLTSAANAKAIKMWQPAIMRLTRNIPMSPLVQQQRLKKVRSQMMIATFTDIINGLKIIAKRYNIHQMNFFYGLSGPSYDMLQLKKENRLLSP
jgi:hypothetical protein